MEVLWVTINKWYIINIPLLLIQVEIMLKPEFQDENLEFLEENIEFQNENLEFLEENIEFQDENLDFQEEEPPKEKQENKKIIILK